MSRQKGTSAKEMASQGVASKEVTSENSDITEHHEDVQEEPTDDGMFPVGSCVAGRMHHVFATACENCGKRKGECLYCGAVDDELEDADACLFT